MNFADPPKLGILPLCPKDKVGWISLTVLSLASLQATYMQCPTLDACTTRRAF